MILGTLRLCAHGRVGGNSPLSLQRTISQQVRLCHRLSAARWYPPLSQKDRAELRQKLRSPWEPARISGRPDLIFSQGVDNSRAVAEMTRAVRARVTQEGWHSLRVPKLEIIRFGAKDVVVEEGFPISYDRRVIEWQWECQPAFLQTAATQLFELLQAMPEIGYLGFRNIPLYEGQILLRDLGGFSLLRPHIGVLRCFPPELGQRLAPIDDETAQKILAERRLEWEKNQDIVLWHRRRKLVNAAPIEPWPLRVSQPAKEMIKTINQWLAVADPQLPLRHQRQVFLSFHNSWEVFNHYVPAIEELVAARLIHSKLHAGPPVDDPLIEVQC